MSEYKIKEDFKMYIGAVDDPERATQFDARAVIAIIVLIVGVIGGILMMHVNNINKEHTAALDEYRTAFIKDLEYMQNAYDLRLAEELAAQKQRLTSPVLYKPNMSLSDNQNSLCLAIMLFGEERMGSETDMVKIAQSIVMRAEDERWGSNACMVISEGQGTQYSSMGPYLTDIKDIVWGEISDFTPALAKTNAQEMQAWKRIKKIAYDVVDGNYPLLTKANHFISLKELKEIKKWIRNLRVVGYTSGHVLLIDYEYDTEGQRIIYTAESPYSQKRFNEDSWEDFDHGLE
ncbi:hypothetical protein [Vibrio phage BONAISHI]|nr:hypothetical protein [Vibrio phage BONAISHI]